MAEPTSKKCSKCGEVQPLDEFSPNRRTRDGRQSSCKGCARAYRAANPEKRRASQAKYYEANRDAIRARAVANGERERSRAYYAANRERVRAKQAEYAKANRDQKRASDAAYRAANRERIRAYRLAWAEAHREESRRRAAEWARDNPERVAEAQRRRRARKRGAAIGPVDLDALWTGRCALCDVTLDRTIKWPDPLSASVDHIIPLAKGGSHAQDNVQWTCLGCNLRKGARLSP